MASAAQHIIIKYVLRSFRPIIFALLLIGSVGVPAAAWAADETSQGFDLEQVFESTEVAPVIVDGVELFHVRGIRAYPAERRAREIRARIIKLAQDPRVKPESIITIPEDHATEIRAGATRILIVFDVDARLEGLDHPVYAEAIVRLIRQAVTNYRNDRTPEAIRGDAIHAGIATAVFAAILLLLFWFFSRLGHWLKRKSEIAPEEFIKIRSMEIIEAERFWHVMLGLKKFVQVLVTLALFYFYFEYVFGLFPWTRIIATSLFHFVIDPIQTMSHAVIDYIPKLFFLLLFAVAIFIFLKLLRTVFIAIGRGTIKLHGFENEWAWPTYRIVRLVVIAFGLVIVYPYLPGSDSAAFKGVSIFMGVLLSLGSSSAISNVIAGYSLIYRRAFKVGDRVRIGDVWGDVTRMRVLGTHIRTIKNEEVTVPNSVILNSHVVNYSALARTRGLILHTTVGIGYEVPWRQVEAMLRRAATRTAGLMTEPEPFVLQKKLGDFAVEYELNVYCEEVKQMVPVYSALHRNILDEFNRHKVQIMTPAYRSDPQNPKVVPHEQWFAAPAQKNETEPGG